MMLRGIIAGLLLVTSVSACAAQAQDGDAALRSGRYDEAADIFQRRIEAGGSAQAYGGLARVYLETGRYHDAAQLLQDSPFQTELASLLSDALRLQGKREEARSAAAAGLSARDSLSAKLRVALIDYEAGRVASAYELFDTFIDNYNSGISLTSAELAAVGVAVWHLGARDPQLFRDALKAFDEAVRADPGNHDAQVLVGRLFLEKYNSADARTAFTQVLRVNPRHADAQAGLAAVLAFDNQPGALDSARRALATNPAHAGARSLLVHAFLLTDAMDSARVHAAALARFDPRSIEAIIAQAAVDQAMGNEARLRAAQAAVRGNRVAAASLATALAELSVQRRQYAQAVRLAEEAIAADSSWWQAWSVLGINQLRLGDPVAARRSLERAFAGDPYHVWVKNTLDLLDEMDSFETRATGNFAVIAHGREVDVLAPYVAALGEEAFAKLARRYGYQPVTPVRIELFDRHADFSVRTVGLAGLGALGVAFGNVLVMDAPSARERGEFNWGSTFWHELAHAFHLGMTAHRVPRWFTEGLAVLEERRARAGWGEEGLPSFARAFREDKLLPIAELNRGFVQPSYPEQVQVSYYQASLVLELIEAKHGEAALRDMLRGFAEGRSTEAVLQDVLRTTPAALDAEFRLYAARRAADQSRLAAARAANDYDALLAQNTIASLEKAIYISPYEPALHARLAELYEKSGDQQGRVRERAVIVALQPVDMAEARYQLARAHFDAGDRAAARREVLRALEAAPSFERAQTLLLELSEAR